MVELNKKTPPSQLLEDNLFLLSLLFGNTVFLTISIIILAASRSDASIASKTWLTDISPSFDDFNVSQTEIIDFQKRTI